MFRVDEGGYSAELLRFLEELNRRWGLNYWGMNINTWGEFYDRPGVTNPSYKLWWERWNRKVTADFLNWQADIVNEYRRPDQFVTHCFMPYFYNIDQVEAFRQMDYPAINIYYTMQDAQDGMWIAYAGDFMRPVCRRGNFLVTETNAQGTGWSSRDLSGAKAADGKAAAGGKKYGVTDPKNSKN